MNAIAKVTTKHQDFAKVFESNNAFRSKVLKAVQDLIDLEESNPTTWAELTDFIGDSLSLSVKSVPGLVLGEHLVFPVAEYGWDGGNPVETQTVNLTSLIDTDIAGGPMASISKRTDANLPGFAIHKFDDEFLIQIF